MSENKRGFLQVNNQIVDYWMAELTNAEFKTLLAIVRKTKGWNKPYDRISQSQIAELTGLTTRSVRTAITALEEKELIIVTGDDHKMRLFSVNYKTVNNVKTDVTDMEKAIEDAKKQAEVISKDAEVTSHEQEVISKDAEVGFLHNIQAIDTNKRQTTESESVVFEKLYELFKTKLLVSGIIPVGKKVNDDLLKPEIYSYLSWCDKKGMSENERELSLIGFFKKKSIDDRKQFYTFPEESGRNYYTGSDKPQTKKVTDEEAAAIRAKYMGAMEL